MKYFIDTEFIEDGKTIDLISIGVVAEDGREFYKQNVYCKFERASEWVRENVYPHLLDFDTENMSPKEQNPSIWLTTPQIGFTLQRFVGDDTPQWWGYCSAYDHVALSQLFGRMIDLPAGWPYLTCDLEQLRLMIDPTITLGKLVPPMALLHDALQDARWNRQAYGALMELAAAGKMSAT